jgi:hypothetical protein
VKKWHIALGVIVIILAIAIFFFARVTTTYSTQAVAAAADSPIGMAPFTDRIDFGDIPLGDSITKTVVLTNNGDHDNTIKVFVIGSISQLIQVTPGKSFTLAADQTQDLNLRLSMPASAPVGKKFTGRVFILRLP